MATREILYATDYSDASRAAVDVAGSMARQCGATLLIAHVTEREQYPVGEQFDEDPLPDVDELKTLHAIVPADPDIKYEHRLLYGEPGSAEITDPANVILKLARQEHVEAIVLSMTPAERADPSLLNGNRKLRIAKGSGRTVQEENRLLEQFQQMRKLSKFMKRM